jgi:hypothetical protein
MVAARLAGCWLLAAATLRLPGVPDHGASGRGSRAQKKKRNEEIFSRVAASGPGKSPNPCSRRAQRACPCSHESRPAPPPRTLCLASDRLPAGPVRGLPSSSWDAFLASEGAQCLCQSAALALACASSRHKFPVQNHRGAPRGRWGACRRHLQRSQNKLKSHHTVACRSHPHTPPRSGQRVGI